MTFRFSNSFNMTVDAQNDSVLNVHTFQPFFVWLGGFDCNEGNAFQVFGVGGAIQVNIQGWMIEL